jgi:hypothetical protein
MVQIRGTNIMRPAWKTTRMSPVGMDTRVWEQLNKNDRLAFIRRTSPVLRHVVLWHDFFPTDTATPSDVWDSLWQMDRRFKAVKHAAKQAGVGGGFAMREVDRAWYDDKEGVLAHLHVLLGLPQGARVAEVDTALANAWKDSALVPEYLNDYFVASEPPLDDLENVIQYVAGTRRVQGERFAKFLDGFHKIKWTTPSQDEDVRKQRWNLKGYTTARQLHLMLAAAAYPPQQPRWFLGWNFTTTEGKRLRKVYA